MNGVLGLIGPPAAKVVRVDTEEMEVKEGASGFKKVRWGEKPPMDV